VQFNTPLRDIDALSNISWVGGNYYLYTQSSLTTLRALSNLTYVGGEFGIYRMGGLTSLDELVSLQYVMGLLSIYDSDALVSVNIPSLLYAYQTEIGASANIVNINIPNAFTSSISIVDNLKLQRLEGFNGVYGDNRMSLFSITGTNIVLRYVRGFNSAVWIQNWVFDVINQSINSSFVTCSSKPTTHSSSHVIG
jgi:hypothetical protein